MTTTASEKTARKRRSAKMPPGATSTTTPAGIAAHDAEVPKRQCRDCNGTCEVDGFTCPSCGGIGYVPDDEPLPTDSQVTDKPSLGLDPDEGRPTITQDTPVVVDAVIAEIEWHPENPRQEFDDAELLGLGESMKRVGTIQPIVVRPHPDNASEFVWQGLAGERRFRAAKRVGMERIQASVRHVDDATALDIVVTENFDRVELNPIEQARAIASLVKSGMTQKAVAERYGHKQSWAANMLRLLQLPESVQALVISGEIDQPKARELVPLAKHPQLLDGIAKAIKTSEDYDDWRGDRDCFKSAVRYFLLDETGGIGSDLLQILTAEEKEELQIVELPLPTYNGSPQKQQRALNKEAYDRILATHNKKAGRNSEEATTEAPKARAELTPAELRKKKAEQAKHLQLRILEWKRRWQRFMLSRTLLPVFTAETVADVQLWHVKAMLYFATEHGGSSNASLAAAALKDIGSSVPSGYFHRGWQLVDRTEETEWLMLAMLRRGFWPDHDKGRCDASNKHGMSDIGHEVVEAIAAEAGFDYQQAWDLIQSPVAEGDDNADFRDRFKEFLDLHMKDQLIEQAEEWGLDVSEAKTKPAIIELIFNYEGALALPKCIAPKKPQRGRKAKKAKAKRKAAR